MRKRSATANPASLNTGNGKWVLLQQQIILMNRLRRDGDQQRAAFAQLRIEIAPGLQLRQAVRAPAPAEKS